MQQFRIRGAITNRVMNEVSAVDNLRLENQLTELKSLSASINKSHQSKFVEYTLLWSTQSIYAPHYRKQIETNTVDNRIKLDSLMVNNLKDCSSTGQVRVKGNMQSQDLDSHQTCRLRITITISN
ncbi:hypothetical protein CR513_22148, partial [Mucuna pruriens]